ncbi:MAG: hypothetical protein ABI625_13520 [bacterium]
MRSVRFSDIRTDLSWRLWFVNKRMPTVEYDAMIDDIAVLQYQAEIALRSGL